MAQATAVRIHVTGTVQGVGFRPFVYKLAKELNLVGWVRNTSAGVDIEVEGDDNAVSRFRQALIAETPPLARIDKLQADPIRFNGFTSFEIIRSQPIAGAYQPISPDMSLCPDCLKELFDPSDRRYRYPFINCTNCGPRFTIINDIPYDRPKTTMAPFPMCPECEREYNDPLDRRFHAQPVACPNCGPQVWLVFAGKENQGEIAAGGEDGIRLARKLLCEGNVVAIKGLGGFHLACDATNGAAVDELRRRKLRVDKPFAIMMWDDKVVARHCQVSEAEQRLLMSAERPIVILDRLNGTTIVAGIAPGQNSLGVMLPYTPLHYLLMKPEQGFPEALVMTSGNLSEEPIAIDNDEALKRLAKLADAFLLHDRDIRTRCDDSVMRLLPAKSKVSLANCPLPLRRSRGYAPFPVKLAWEVPPLLAVGAELKNVFCLTQERYAFLSHHVGDMENYETLRSFEDGVTHFERLFRVRPEAIAYDLHPNYLATRYAMERAESEDLPAFGVQHHYAHVVACMAEHGHPDDRPVIGVAFDGTGYGDDGAIWGGEFLVADYDGYRRVAHLDYVPLPGGDRAIKEPWRMALSWLWRAGISDKLDLPPAIGELFAHGNGPSGSTGLQAVRHQIETGINAPPTSSMGRLFDAVAAIAGLRQTVNYEAQAAIELEALIDPDESDSYRFAVNEGVIDAVPVITAVTADGRAGAKISKIAARFHNGVAQMVANTCLQLRQQFDLSEVVLSGGVWQNMALLTRTVRILESRGFTVMIHHQVPPNDGCLSLGQAVAAARRIAGSGS